MKTSGIRTFPEICKSDDAFAICWFCLLTVCATCWIMNKNVLLLLSVMVKMKLAIYVSYQSEVVVPCGRHGVLVVYQALAS